MAGSLPGIDPRAIIDGRPRAGLIIGTAGAVVCAFAVLAVDALQSEDSLAHSAVPFLVALPLALLPVPFLITLVLLLDRLEPEPRVTLAFAFAWGAGIAALLAALINTAGLLFITQPTLGKSTGEYVSATFGAPLVEESLKGAVLAWLLWKRRLELDGPTDGIIYATMVGLGFAMMENIGYYIGALVRPAVGGVSLLGVTFVFRGVLSAFAHPAFTSMTGIGAAYAATRRRGEWALAAGLLAAMILHGLWNGLTVLGLGGIALAYGMLLCVITVLIAVIVAERHRIVRLIYRLPGYIPDGLVTDADMTMLTSLRARRRARLRAMNTGGRKVARAVTHYQLAATELALCHQRAERGAIDPDRFTERTTALIMLMTAARATSPWPHGGRGPFGGRSGRG